MIKNLRLVLLRALSCQAAEFRLTEDLLVLCVKFSSVLILRCLTA